MPPSCNLSCPCQGPWGSGLLTLPSWASSFPSNVEFCPAQALPGRRREINAALCPCHQPSCPPRGNSQQRGRQGPQSWDTPGDVQNGSGQHPEPAGCSWSWPGRDQRSQGPFSSPEQPLAPHPPAPTALLAPGRPGCSGRSWGLVFLRRLETNCHGLSEASVPALSCARLAPKGLEELPQRTQELSLPVPWRLEGTSSSSA